MSNPKLLTILLDPDIQSRAFAERDAVSGWDRLVTISYTTVVKGVARDSCAPPANMLVLVALA
ncbi:hypothetical protein NB311A_04619 [Nitrobacter sp. Nb-311A]|nr:hypothetical protein NB311A_04619 [Nitrobacter sp. Nb-311A]